MKKFSKEEAATVVAEVVERTGYVKKSLLQRMMGALGITSVSGQGDVIRMAGIKPNRRNRRHPADGYWPADKP